MADLYGWATCPIIENGFLRILGHPNYPGFGPGSPEGAAVALRALKMASPMNRFFPDDFSILSFFSTLEGISSNQLTDIYLLALAMKNNAQLLTLDRRIDPSLVPGGQKAYEVLL